MSGKRYVIIGDGAAGTTAAQYIRHGDAGGTIEIISDDPHPAYFRAALTNYLIGELREEQLWAVPPTFYRENRITRTLGRVVAVDTVRSQLHLSRGGAPQAYDYLVIAAGAAARQPPFDGAELPGVMVMRTLHDVRGVMERIKLHGLNRAVIVGGGPLALEWVQGLHERGVAVTYLLRKRRLMSRLLDPVASDLTLARLRLAGVDVRLEEEVAEALPGGDGRVRSVLLKSGELLDCQLVGVAIGVDCNAAFLGGSGLAHGQRGALAVDDRLRTNVDNIYAAGDIADVDGFLPQLWEPARRQGRIAAANVTGREAHYDPGVHYNATRLYDLDVAAVGETLDSGDANALLDFPQGDGRIAYRKLLLRDGRLVGALLLGRRSENIRARGRLYKRLIDSGADVSDLARHGRSLPPLLDPAYDLAAWLDRRDLLARPAAAEASIASPAQLRQTHVWGRADVTAARSAAARTAVRPAGALLAANRGQRFPLATQLRLGRGTDNDVVLDDRQVSARHAVIRWQGDRYYVNDVGSGNGTFHNEARVARPMPLVDGDRLRLGQTHFRVSLPAAVSDGRSPTAGRPGAPELPADAARARLSGAGRHWPLAAPLVAIGRDADNDVIVDDEAVSHLHAQISRHGADFYLRDVGSRNGTWLGDRPVIIPYPLQDGDSFIVGRTTLTFHSTAAPKTPRAPAETAVTPTHLVVRSGNQLGLTFALTEGVMRLGRDPSSHIHLDALSVSWHHATLTATEGQWLLSDVDSRNGTRVNDRPLAPRTPQPLTDGDVLRMGEVSLLFRLGRQDAPAPVVIPARRATTLLHGDCPHCGRPFAPEVRMCPHCGEAVVVPPATGPALAVLVASGTAGQRYPLLGYILIGREPDADIVLSEPTVSGHHAEIVGDAAGLRIRDLGSRNGTYLNGRRLTIHFEPLAPGDTIMLGQNSHFGVEAGPR